MFATRATPSNQDSAQGALANGKVVLRRKKCQVLLMIEKSPRNHSICNKYTSLSVFATTSMQIEFHATKKSDSQTTLSTGHLMSQ